MIPLGVLASARVAAAGTYLLHDTFDCGTTHLLPAHSTAGHTSAGGPWVQSHNWEVSDTYGRAVAGFSAYNGRALTNVGATEVTVTARIVGQVTGAGGTDRPYGLVLGAPSVTDPTNAVIVTVNSAGDVRSNQTGATWVAPNINAGPDSTAVTDDYTLSLSLSGTTVTIGINGTTHATYTVANAVTGTYAGIFAGRSNWSTSIGYDWITVEAA